MRVLLGWFRHEPVLKIVSLAIALCLWAWRSAEGNPYEERRFTELQIAVERLSKDLHVVNDPPPVEVVLSGPRRTLDRLQESGAVEPYVDCNELDRPTWKSVPIQIRRPENAKVTVRSVKPEEWEVEVDTIENDIKPIRVDVGNTSPPKGYIYEPPKLSHDQAHVRGPRKRVIRVAYLAAKVDLSGRYQDTPVTVLLQPRDSAGNDVTGVDCVPKLVDVTVKIARLEQSRELPVAAPRVNEPPQGYRFRGLEITPPTVEVRGTAAGLQRLGESLLTQPVDLQGRTASFQTSVPLDVPPGVVAEPTQVEVRVTITPDTVD